MTLLTKFVLIPVIAIAWCLPPAYAQFGGHDLFGLSGQILRQLDDHNWRDERPPKRRQPVSPKYDPADVTEAQVLLGGLGYEPGPPDGRMGRRTSRAIAAFQRDNRLRITGVPDDDLLTALRGIASTAPAIPERGSNAPGNAKASRGSRSDVSEAMNDKVMRFIRDRYNFLDRLVDIAPEHITIIPVDLNEDGIDEAFLFLTDRAFCGAAHCAIFILDFRGPDANSIADLLGVSLEAASEKTHGWHDVVLDGQRLVFDGGEYVHADDVVPEDLVSQKAVPDRNAPKIYSEPELQAKVMRFLGELDVNAPLENEDRKISIDLVDLNGDNFPEALVIVEGRLQCGTRGCAANVLDLSGTEARSIGDFIAFELVPAETKTNSWRDIRIGGLRQVFHDGQYVAEWKATDGSIVAYVQRLLNEAGYNVGTIDGRMGKRTRNAIRRYQSDNALRITGEPDREVLYSLQQPKSGSAAARGATEPRAETTVPVTAEGPAGSGDCVPVLFGSDQTSADVSGSAPPDDVVCYSLRTVAGQRVNIKVVAGKNIIFSVKGLADARDQYDFVADRSRYEFVVGQLMRAVAPKDFRIRIDITVPATAAGLPQPGVAPMPSTHGQNSMPDAEHPANGNGLSTDPNCTNRPPNTSISQPTVILPTAGGDTETSMLFSDGPDTIVIDRTDKVISYRAGAGDDVFYINGPKAGTEILGENGGDTFIICSLGDASTVVVVGPPDTDSDTVIIDSGVFAAAPVGPSHIAIGGLVSVNDRLVVHAPEGAAIRYGEMEIKIGQVIINIMPGSAGGAIGDGASRGFDVASISIISGSGKVVHPPASLARMHNMLGLKPPKGKIVVSDRAVTLAGTAVTDISDAAPCPEPRDIAGPSQPLVLSPPEALGGRVLAYGDDDDVIVSDATESDLFAAIFGGAGDDRFYVFNPVSGTQLTGNTGADRFNLCSLEGDQTFIVLSMSDEEFTRDTDNDVLAIQPDAFQRVPPGFESQIMVFGFTSHNDRIFLRLPPGNEVRFGQDATGIASIRTGNTLIAVSSSDAFQQRFNWDSIVIVPDTLAIENKQQSSDNTAGVGEITSVWLWGQPKTLTGEVTTLEKPRPSCSDMQAEDAKKAIAMPAEAITSAATASAPYQYYTHGDDLARIVGTGKQIEVRAGLGDDEIYMFNVGDGSRIIAGPGADLMVLCSMHGIKLHLSSGPITVDRQPDTIFIEPAVFQNVPDGFIREIEIFGFLPTSDRLVLRVPNGIRVSAKKVPNDRGYVLTAGEVRITVATGVPYLDIPFEGNAIVIVSALEL